MVAPGREKKGSRVSPPPALPTDICCKFYILLLLPWFLYPWREPLWSLSLCQPWEEGSSPVAGFLSVLRAFCVYWMRERASCVVFSLQSILMFFFFLFMSFLKYTVHHLGSVHVTKNSPGISWSGEKSGNS